MGDPKDQVGIGVGYRSGVSATSHDPHRDAVQNSAIPEEYKTDFLDDGNKGSRPSYYGPSVQLFYDRFLLDWFALGAAANYGYLTPSKLGEGDYLHALGVDFRATARLSSLWTFPIELQLRAKAGYEFLTGMTTFNQDPDPVSTQLHSLNAGLTAMLGYRFHIGENLELNLFVEGGWKPTFQTWGNNNVPSQLDGWGAMGGAAFSFPTSPSEVKKDDAPLADDAGGGGGGGGNDNGEGSRVIVSNTPPLPEKECTECLPAVRDIAIAQTDYIFNYNEATFTEEGRTAILETGAAVKEAVKDTDMTGSEVLIILTGHASPEGKEEKNLALSKKRIAAAVELLQKEVFNNVNYPVLVVYKAKGETELKAVDLGEVDKKDRNTVVVNRSEDDWSLILVSEKDEKNPQEHTIGEGAAGKTHMSFEVGGKTYLVPLSENRRVSIIVRVILKTGLENEREWDGVQRIDTPPPAEPPPAEPVPTEPPPAQP